MLPLLSWTSINPFLTLWSLLRRCLPFMEVFKSILWIRVVFFFLTKAIVKCSGAIPKSFNTSITPSIPLLKFKIAEHTPTSNVCLGTNTSFGHFCQITPLRASLLFWVVPCRHLLRSSGELSRVKIGFSASRKYDGKPGLSTWLLVPLAKSVWYLHHD